MMDYSELLTEIVKQMNEMNVSLQEISDGLAGLSSSIQSGDGHSIAEEILETRYRIKEAIIDAADKICESINGISETIDASQ